MLSAKAALQKPTLCCPQPQPTLLVLDLFLFSLLQPLLPADPNSTPTFPSNYFPRFPPSWPNTNPCPYTDFFPSTPILVTPTPCTTLSWLVYLPEVLKGTIAFDRVLHGITWPPQQLLLFRQLLLYSGSNTGIRSAARGT